MKNIRIGKDIVLTWTVLIDGAAVDLEDKDLTLYLISEATGKKKQMPFTADDSELSFTYYGTEQETLGTYRLTLWLNKGQEGQSVLDESYAFNLVPRTEMEGEDDEDNLTTATVELSGDLVTGVDADYAELEARVEAIEDEGLVLSTTIGADTISLDNSEGDAVVTLPAATETTAGLMSAAQVSELASKADATDLIASTTIGTDSISLDDADGDAVVTLSAATSALAGLMSASQADALNNAATATALAAVYNTAIGVGTETALTAIMKAETITSGNALNDRLNHLLYDTGSGVLAETNGLHLMRYSNTGTIGLLLQTGYMRNYGSAESYRRQFLIGGFKIGSNPDSSAEGTVWSNYGFVDNIAWDNTAISIYTRKVVWGADGTISTTPTAWQRAAATPSELIAALTAESAVVKLQTSGGTDVVTIPTATTTTAGVMSAAQASTLASAAASTSVPDGATADASAVTLQNNGTDLFALPASSTTQAGTMSASQATSLASKADSPTLSVQSTAPATLTPTINTYTRIDAAVGTMSVTLPAIEAGTFSALSIAFTSSATPAVTFTTADGKSIVYASDFAIDAETKYEISALFNGVNWVLAYVTFD